MGVGRSIATKLLRSMLRCAPEERRGWVEAMLRELDFVETDGDAGTDSGSGRGRGEWAALSWALGCTVVVFRECARGWGAALGQILGIRSKEEGKMNSTGKKTLGVLAGIGVALVLGVAFFFMAPSISQALVTVGVPRTMWSHILTVILPAEIIVVVAAIVLWRRHRAPIAVGMLLTGFVMAAHVVVHVAMH